MKKPWNIFQRIRLCLPELPSVPRAFRVINSLKYARIASNLGDLRTLVIHPASTLYVRTSKAEAEKAGVFEDTIRISVGIEDPEDLIQDFLQAVAVSRDARD